MTDTLSANPLVKKSGLKYDAVPFDKIKMEHFLPAQEWAMELARKRIEEIKGQDEATFANTIEALENATGELTQITKTFGSLGVLLKTDAYKSIEEKFKEKGVNFGADIIQDADLFSCIKQVYINRDAEGLTPEQKVLVEKTYEEFVRNGANLLGEAKERYRKIQIELSELTTKFSNNLLNEAKSFELVVDKEEDLAGLPEDHVKLARKKAEAKGYPNKWVFTLEAAQVIAVGTYAENRELRRKLRAAFVRRGATPPNDNREITMQIVKLRHEMAQLLGYETFAQYTLAGERMAKKPQEVYDMLAKIQAASKPAAERDVAEIKAYAREKDGIEDFQAWDLGYYSEKLQQEKYSFDEEKLRPYLQYENVLQGAFGVATNLYGLTFKKSDDYPVYAEDVEVYEVLDKSGEIVGVMYTDFFPREGLKKSGAWMDDYRAQRKVDGKREIPIVGIHGNFMPPGDGKPSLLTADEVRTLFHEFGHGLHGLLSNVTYSSLASPNVFWDFVELPSQFMENFAINKEVLKSFARHWQTGETIPDDLLAKKEAAEKFMAGWASLRQVEFAKLDFAYYDADPTTLGSVEEVEKRVFDETKILDRGDALQSTSFSHIFSGGYSAGYYSYKWAEALDADAFAAFEETGNIFDQRMAGLFRTLLESGNTVMPGVLYENFRGRAPDPDALLRRDGLLPANDDSGKGKKPRPSAGL